jgi:hypothetical protein
MFWQIKKSQAKVHLVSGFFVFVRIHVFGKSLNLLKNDTLVSGCSQGGTN